MRAAYGEVVLPLLRRFRPSCVVVSAGYDSHWLDPLASMQLRTPTWVSLLLLVAVDVSPST